jgi:hypothetical protein
MTPDYIAIGFRDVPTASTENSVTPSSHCKGSEKFFW